MTIGEVARAIESKKRVEKIKQQRKATSDYILADLIGRSISRITSSSNKMPPIYDVYPQLFDKEEIESKEQEEKDRLSIIRFEQFVNAHNSKYKGGEKQ